MPETDAYWMQRAIELAKQGEGYVEPNPMVGAVVLDRDGICCGEGWHEEFGGPHAEVNALATAGSRAAGGTLYVTLEPCHHHGKTPPCTSAVETTGISRVVIGCLDPAKHQQETGADYLRSRGIEVTSGVLEAEAAALIAPFRTLMTAGRPFVHGKWAMSLDGRIATRTRHSQWITGPDARLVGHQIRGRMDAVLVGIGTVLHDDPLLTARPPGIRTATRVVLDSQARLPLDSHLVKTNKEAPVLLFVSETAEQQRVQQLEEAGVTVVRISNDAHWHVDIEHVLKELGTRQMTNVLVEGGSSVLGSLWDRDLIDEVHVFVAPKIIGGSEALGPVGGVGRDKVPDITSLRGMNMQLVGEDVYLHGRVGRS
ncbi:MAG: bifunctional diaminohydroxyphosphoribosylaminopyrimidine deaminase/5-amino-6-(5-phosphoribosylamino)uracil reductase RibD [Planctomycetaceae bacterium]|nr:bifunctional diaminohydroxyphosphoribosylaminopyrimidine deaminase/5-amino-6-(5-phosphoribosylamino)uracil reductase RibD [Planctomycetaceae bacterium]MCB9952721.1 bifunctional diaminohydroxyphosphoribosylaminopyrimidine deaminase/5-amino-6-(5-phosphoribosylamino)uracil reductase RibD [Planctomycetaceae bacterium]